MFKISQNIKYSDVLDMWLVNKKGTIKDTSYSKYETVIINYIKPILGATIFAKLTSKELEMFFSNERIEFLSDSIKKTLLIIIKSSIKYGFKNNYRKHNIIIDIKLKKPKNKIIYFTRKEQEILDNYLKNNINLNNLGILLTLYSGLRLGELCGLKWEDIDFINNTLSVNKTVERIKNTDINITSKTILIITSPKTQSSNRIIPIPSFIIDLLKIYKSEEQNFILSNNIKPKDPRSVEKHFSKITQICNIRNLNFHALRHTYSTRLKEENADIKVISELLGHSDWKITQDIYIHTSEEYKQKAVDLLVKCFK